MVAHLRAWSQWTLWRANMDHEDPRSEAAAKSRRSARRALKRLRTVRERERREREREQRALDPVQAIMLAMSRAGTENDRRRLAMRIARRRRQFEQAEQALADGIRPLLIIGVPASLAGISERLRLMDLADEADALVVYIDD